MRNPSLERLIGMAPTKRVRRGKAKKAPAILKAEMEEHVHEAVNTTQHTLEAMVETLGRQLEIQSFDLFHCPSEFFL